MTIYIAGKITGEEVEACYRKFRHAASVADMHPFYMDFQHFRLIKTIRANDSSTVTTVNPLKLDGIRFGIGHEDAMKICIKALSECTHAYFLEDWKDSKGARMEHEYCVSNGIEVVYQ